MKHLNWKLVTDRWILYAEGMLALIDAPRGIVDSKGGLGVEERVADEDGVSHQSEGGVA